MPIPDTVGAFAIVLSNDLKVAIPFWERMGFARTGGDSNYIIMTGGAARCKADRSREGGCGTTDAYGQCRCKTREARSDVTCTAAEMVAVAQACAVKGAPLRGRVELALDRATRRQGNGYAVNGMYALAHGTSENAKVIPRASDR